MKARKPVPIKKLIAKADRLFSLLVRQSNSFGEYCKCYTCKRVHRWKEMDCGHYISRVYLATRWDERNCRVQCKKCNRWLHGNREIFRERLVKEYGENVVKEMEASIHDLVLNLPERLPIIIKKYQTLPRRTS